jgi:hypothetical protein
MIFLNGGEFISMQAHSSVMDIPLQGIIDDAVKAAGDREGSRQDRLRILPIVEIAFSLIHSFEN